jgi:hypothetical protein
MQENCSTPPFSKPQNKSFQSKDLMDVPSFLPSPFFGLVAKTGTCSRLISLYSILFSCLHGVMIDHNNNKKLLGLGTDHGEGTRNLYKIRMKESTILNGQQVYQTLRVPVRCSADNDEVNSAFNELSAFPKTRDGGPPCAHYLHQGCAMACDAKGIGSGRIKQFLKTKQSSK